MYAAVSQNSFSLREKVRMRVPLPLGTAPRRVMTLAFDTLDPHLSPLPQGEEMM
jgi:hypothetical protein